MVMHNLFNIIFDLGNLRDGVVEETVCLGGRIILSITLSLVPYVVDPPTEDYKGAWEGFHYACQPHCGVHCGAIFERLVRTAERGICRIILSYSVCLFCLVC